MRCLSHCLALCKCSGNTNWSVLLKNTQRRSDSAFVVCSLEFTPRGNMRLKLRLPFIGPVTRNPHLVRKVPLWWEAYAPCSGWCSGVDAKSLKPRGKVPNAQHPSTTRIGNERRWWELLGLSFFMCKMGKQYIPEDFVMVVKHSVWSLVQRRCSANDRQTDTCTHHGYLSDKENRGGDQIQFCLP